MHFGNAYVDVILQEQGNKEASQTTKTLLNTKTLQVLTVCEICQQRQTNAADAESSRLRPQFPLWEAIPFRAELFVFWNADVQTPHRQNRNDQ